MPQTPAGWRREVDVLFSAEQIAQRVRTLGTEITRDFATEPLTVIGILKGSFVFMADLTRAIDLPIKSEFVGTSSYGDATSSSGVVKITLDLNRPITDEHVLLVEDIVDTGLSMRYLLDNLATRRPKSIRVCALLDKPENREVPVPIDYVGFTIPNHFVIGYGLDVAGLYRNLPFIGVYRGPAR